MNFLSSILLCTAINVDTLTSSFSLKDDASLTLKFKIFFASIFTTIITFLSLCFGRIIDIYFTQNLSNIFGSVLLGFTGIYYIIEHIRVLKDRQGFDTSHYAENFKEYKNLIEITKSYTQKISRKHFLDICIALSLNNIWPCIAGSLTSISFPLIILFNFLLCMLFIICGQFITKQSFIRFISSYHYLITSILLIILSLIEGFI